MTWYVSVNWGEVFSASSARLFSLCISAPRSIVPSGPLAFPDKKCNLSLQLDRISIDVFYGTAFDDAIIGVMNGMGIARGCPGKVFRTVMAIGNSHLSPEKQVASAGSVRGNNTLHISDPPSPGLGTACQSPGTRMLHRASVIRMTCCRLLRPQVR